jgi:hypothetical protein
VISPHRVQRETAANQTVMPHSPEPMFQTRPVSKYVWACLSLHSGSPVSPTEEAPLLAMQLGLASAAALHSGASQLRPEDPKWLHLRADRHTRGRPHAKLFQRRTTQSRVRGKANIDSPVLPCELEETRTTAVERPERRGVGPFLQPKTGFFDDMAFAE